MGEPALWENLTPMKKQSYQLKAGNLANMKLVTSDLPTPQPHEISIGIKTIGLNFADCFAIWGLYSATPKGIFTPGLEYAGEVIAVGADVNDFKVGDKVMGITRFGAYTTHLNIDQRYVTLLPPGWSFEVGAAFLVQVLTAYYGLIPLGNLQKNATVLIHSAAGGVGLLANKIAKKYNAYTIGTVGSPAKVDFLKQEGYDQTIVRGDDFAEKLKTTLGQRELNVIMECIGGKIFTEGFKQLAPQGRLVIYGSARYASPGDKPNYVKLMYQHFTRPKIDPQNLIHENKAIMGFNLIWLYEQAELMRTILTEVEALQLSPPHVGHTFDFKDLPEAIRFFQTGKTIGKVVVNVG